MGMIFCFIVQTLMYVLVVMSTYRIFRVMDDDGSKKLDYDEFKKGIHDYGLVMEDPVRVV